MSKLEDLKLISLSKINVQFVIFDVSKTLNVKSYSFVIEETEFFERMSQKIAQASQMNDKMSFTKMSKNVLNAPYKDQYINVYQKGALIAMCMDIIIREESKGQKGILTLMPCKDKIG